MSAETENMVIGLAWLYATLDVVAILGVILHYAQDFDDARRRKYLAIYVVTMALSGPLTLLALIVLGITWAAKKSYALWGIAFPRERRENGQ